MTLHYVLMANQAMLQKLLMKKLSDTDLTPGQPKILDYLVDHDGVNQTEIAAACYIEPASLTSALNGMEAKGLVERRRMDGDRRSYYIFLTEKGWDMCHRVKVAFGELEEDAFRVLTNQQRLIFSEAFECLNGSLRHMMEESGKETNGNEKS